MEKRFVITSYSIHYTKLYEVNQDGTSSFAGWAPHLDLEAFPESEKTHLLQELQAPWLNGDLERQAMALATEKLVPEHFEEVSSRRIANIDKTLDAVNQRLTSEIAFWSDRYIKLKEDKEAGKDVRLQIENVRRTVDDLSSRLENRNRITSYNVCYTKLLRRAYDAQNYPRSYPSF